MLRLTGLLKLIVYIESCSCKLQAYPSEVENFGQQLRKYNIKDRSLFEVSDFELTMLVVFNYRFVRDLRTKVIFMRKSLALITIICFLFFAPAVHSQTRAVKFKTNANDTLTITEMISMNGGLGEGTRTYKILGKNYAYGKMDLDSVPQFPGGEDKFMDTIQCKAKALYPEPRYHFNIKFVIDYDGRLIDFRFIPSQHPDIDKKLIKFIKSLPRWTPGIKDNKHVKFKFEFTCRPF